MSADGPQQLAGYRLRDYEDFIARLRSSWLSQGITLAEIAARIGGQLQAVSLHLRGGAEARGRRVFELASGLGYDLALIPQPGEDAPRAHRSEPQSDESGSGVGRDNPEALSASQADVLASLYALNPQERP